MALNEFHDETLHCGGGIDCDPLGDLNLTLTKWENILILALIMLGARVAAFISLKYKVDKLA